jgi:hypothetical protein
MKLEEKARAAAHIGHIVDKLVVCGKDNELMKLFTHCRDVEERAFPNDAEFNKNLRAFRARLLEFDQGQPAHKRD